MHREPFQRASLFTVYHVNSDTTARDVYDSCLDQHNVRLISAGYVSSKNVLDVSAVASGAIVRIHQKRREKFLQKEMR